MSEGALLENGVELQFQSNDVFDPPEVDVVLPIEEEDEEPGSEGEEEIEAQRRFGGPTFTNLPPALRSGAPEADFRHEEGGIEQNDQEDDQLQMEEVFEQLLRKSIQGFMFVLEELQNLTRDGPNPGTMRLLLDETEKARVACKYFSTPNLLVAFVDMTLT